MELRRRTGTAPHPRRPRRARGWALTWAPGHWRAGLSLPGLQSHLETLAMEVVWQWGRNHSQTRDLGVNPS